MKNYISRAIEYARSHIPRAGTAVAAALIPITAAGCATVQNYPSKELMKPIPKNVKIEQVDLSPLDAEAASLNLPQGADLTAQIDASVASLANKEKAISTVMNGEYEKRDGVGAFVPNKGVSTFVIPNDTSKLTHKRRSIEDIVTVESADFSNTVTRGLGSREQTIYDVTTYLRGLVGNGSLHIATLDFQDSKMTGGFESVMILYNGEQKIHPQVFARNIQWLDIKLNEKVIPSMSIVLSRDGPRVEYRVDAFVDAIEKAIGVSLDGYRTSETFGQWKMGLGGGAARLAVKEIFNLAKDPKKGKDVSYHPELDLGPDGSSLDNMQKFWRSYGLENVPEVCYFLPIKYGDVNAVVALMSSRKEVMENPLAVQVGIYNTIDNTISGYSLISPAYIGENAAYNLLRDYTAAKVGAAVEKGLYEEKTVTQMRIMTVPTPYGVIRIPYPVQVPVPYPVPTPTPPPSGGVGGGMGVGGGVGGGDGTTPPPSGGVGGGMGTGGGVSGGSGTTGTGTSGGMGLNGGVNN